MSRSKIVHLITELNVGGAERALARLLAGLDRERYDPIVVCLYGSESPVADAIRALDIPVIDLGMTGKWRLDALGRLYRLLRDERPAILHSWLFHANIPGRVLGRLAGVPVVISGERTMGMESRWRYGLNRLTVRLADRVVCVSPLVAEFCVDRIGVPRGKTVVIPNGVDLSEAGAWPDKTAARAALGLPAQGVLVGSVARLDAVKRLDVLLQAVASLEDVTVVLVGDGPERERLQAMARRLGIEGRVLLAGYQQDVWPWLAAWDVFALSSEWEGMPNAVLEAMAAGLPVVATRVGGTPDVVVEGETGYLVAPDDPPALARALLSLIREPGQRYRMGAAGRRRVEEQFSVERMVERTQALYEELLPI